MGRRHASSRSTSFRAAILQRVNESRSTLVTLGYAGIAALAAAFALSTARGAWTLTVPLGPPGESIRLAMDAIGASFLLLAAIAFETAPISFAGTVLALLAANGFALVVGVGLAQLPVRRSEAGSLWRILSCLICLITIFAIAGSPGVDFAVIRAAPAEGWHASVILFLTLAAAALLVRTNGLLAIYLLIRVLLDLCGPAQPLWWCVPFLLFGGIGAAFAALRAAVDDTVHEVLASGSLYQIGLAMVGIGLALLARAVDLPAITTLALQATWLSVVCHALCRALLLRCADAVEQGAGTRHLVRTGGLIHRMQSTALCCLAGLFAASIVPPGLGFAAFWLLFQSLLAAARASGFALQLLIVVVAVLIAFSLGIGAIAAVRTFGVVFLGRPRTPRAAVAEEPSRSTRWSLTALAILTALLGVFPGPALAVSADWSGSIGALAPLTLRPAMETPGYASVAVAAFLLAAGSTLHVALRRMGAQERRREAAWSDGFAAPPPWLPFGDPATQYGPVSFTEPLRRIATPWRLPALPVARWRDALRALLLPP